MLAVEVPNFYQLQDIISPRGDWNERVYRQFQKYSEAEQKLITDAIRFRAQVDQLIYDLKQWSNGCPTVTYVFAGKSMPTLEIGLIGGSAKFDIENHIGAKWIDLLVRAGIQTPFDQTKNALFIPQHKAMVSKMLVAGDQMIIDTNDDLGKGGHGLQVTKCGSKMLY